jgi:hypothetical protein
MADDFRALSRTLKDEREQRNGRRERENLAALDRLTREGIEHYARTPYHYRVWRVQNPAQLVEFYPRTGAVVVGSSRRGNGVDALMRALAPTPEREDEDA